MSMAGNPMCGATSVIGRLLEMAGRVMERLHFPARLREFEYVNPISDETIYLSTGSRYSVLHIGEQMLYFDRVTGRFDGTCTSLQKRVANGLELLD
jgi:hypothetical protein